MAGKESWVDERKWRASGAAFAHQRKVPVDHGFVGRDVHAVEGDLKHNAHGMSARHVAAGAKLDADRTNSTQRKQRKGRGPNHVPGQRFESRQQLRNRDDAARCS